jgi:hypothetical protein
MNSWGPDRYGDPCRECGYDWPEDLEATLHIVRETPQRMRNALAGSDGTTRVTGLEWDARGYVCHVGDNLRIWAERLIAARERPGTLVARYDADLLAQARYYHGIPLNAALWSLGRAVDDWLAAVDGAQSPGFALDHPDRGELHLTDVTSANAHDAYHHIFDVQRSVASASAASLEGI